MLHSLVLLVTCFGLLSAASTVQGDPPQPVIDDPPPAPAKGETESFMGIPVGAFVRVTCTAPEIELNNAKLLSVTKTTITVASATGERYNLPREFTEVAKPVNWQRTSGMVNQPLPPPRSGHGWMVLLLLLLAGGGVAAGLALVRRREGTDDTGFASPPKARKLASPALASTGRSRMVLSGAPLAGAGRLNFDTDIPNVSSSSLMKGGTDSAGVEELIENRCYGTAIERLEAQIKSQPDDFKLRLQLLKIYVTIDNHKQADRVMHQIEFHPRFSVEQKSEARLCLPNTKGNGTREPSPAPSSAPATPNGKAESATTATLPTAPAGKPAARPPVTIARPDAQALAEAAARFGLNPASVASASDQAKTSAPPPAKPSKEDGAKTEAASASPAVKPSSKASAKTRTRSRSKSQSSPDAAPAAVPAPAAGGASTRK